MSAQKDKKAPQKPDNKKKIIIGVVAVIVLLTKLRQEWQHLSRGSQSSRTAVFLT